MLKALVEKHHAADTTVRKTAMAELEAMEKRPSQHRPGSEIPEKSWAYRIAKKFWFNDFGKYDNPRSIEEILNGGPPDGGSHDGNKSERPPVEEITQSA
ncbi:MAG: hypothetical protein IIB66_01920 [Proteobacteria bacterium]|nr:hypothetical protein [Pseudomonadota bacterium]